MPWFAKVNDDAPPRWVDEGTRTHERVRRLSRVWVEVQPPDEPEPDQPEPDEVDAFHVGAGWYQLPDGTKVRGKDAATEALNGEEVDGGDD